MDYQHFDMMCVSTLYFPGRLQPILAISPLHLVSSVGALCHILGPAFPCLMTKPPIRTSATKMGCGKRVSFHELLVHVRQVGLKLVSVGKSRMCDAAEEPFRCLFNASFSESLRQQPYTALDQLCCSNSASGQAELFRFRRPSRSRSKRNMYVVDRRVREFVAVADEEATRLSGLSDEMPPQSEN